MEDWRSTAMCELRLLCRASRHERIVKRMWWGQSRPPGACQKVQLVAMGTVSLHKLTSYRCRAKFRTEVVLEMPSIVIIADLATTATRVAREYDVILDRTLWYR